MKLVTLKRKRFIVSVSLLKKSDGELRGPAFFLLARLCLIAKPRPRDRASVSACSRTIASIRRQHTYELCVGVSRYRDAGVFEEACGSGTAV